MSTKNNTSTLSIASDKTGAGNEFTLNDLVGGAVEKTGANTNVREAQDAMFRINGGSIRTSKSNDIDLGGGVKATLVGATEESVSITAGADRQYALDKVKSMVDSYNSLLSSAEENAGNKGASGAEKGKTGAAGGKAVGNCPRCKSDVTESPKGFFCSSPACKFALWKDSRFWSAKGKSLTAKTAAALLKEGRVSFSDLKSERTGKTYAAAIILSDNGEKTDFILEFANSGKKGGAAA